jgi:hypothetical protein
LGKNIIISLINKITHIINWPQVKLEKLMITYVRQKGNFVGIGKDNIQFDSNGGEMENFGPCSRKSGF